MALATQADEPQKSPPVSSYAPAEDLTAQVDYFIKHMDEALTNKADYDDVKKTTVERDSNTLAVIALLLAMHDQDHKLKASASAILKRAQELAENGDDFNTASAALAELKKAVAETTTHQADPPKWEAVAAMSPLMKQVPVIHAPMKRGATDARRFKRQAAQTAGQAATLAAIAQAATYNTDHATEEQIPQWEKFCAQMRDAAGAVNSAARTGDAAKAAQAILALQKSCDDCHAVFHSE